MHSNLSKLRRKADALLAKNRVVEAQAAFRKLCQAAPNDAEAWLNLGAVSGRLQDFPGAEAAFRRVLEINPHLPQAYFNLGGLLVMLGRLHEAEAYWRSYIKIMPASAQGRYQLATVLKNTGRSAEAVSSYDEALRLAPATPEVMLDYGEALQYLGRFAAAEAAYLKALELNGDHARVHLALAELYSLTRHFDRASEEQQRVLAIEPRMAAAVSQLSAVMALRQGQFAAAMAHFNAALRLQPDNIEWRWERALHLLRLGQFEEGWREYEVRSRYWKWLDEMHAYRFDRPRWDGAPLAGRTLLVYAEQGFGDNIQFSRYLPLIAERGGKVLFYCHEELLRLFRRLPGVARVEPRGAAIARERFDVHVPIMSLPHLFATRLETIPARVPYLHADETAVARRREALDPRRFNVGLVWRGRSTHLENLWRSLAPADLAPLAEAAGAKFYCLQKDAPAGELATLAALLDVTDLSPELQDFDDSAALISALDLVISVDTATAHLAAALGRPTWTLLHSPCDWRWLTEREDSPWYPTMRLFRRAPDEEWPAVTARVAAALRAAVEQAARREGFC